MSVVASIEDEYKRYKALADIERTIVQRLNHLRAPLSPEDRVRRRPEQLSPRQIEYLDRWGYHLVLEEFRFHMTLSGPLAVDLQQHVRDVLRDVFRPALEPTHIDDVCIFRQADRERKFELLSRHPLRGATIHRDRQPVICM